MSETVEVCARETAQRNLSSVIWQVRKIAKSDYQLLRVMAVRQNGTTRFPLGGFSLD